MAKLAVALFLIALGSTFCASSSALPRRRLLQGGAPGGGSDGSGGGPSSGVARRGGAQGRGSALLANRTNGAAGAGPILRLPNATAVNTTEDISIATQLLNITGLAANLTVANCTIFAPNDDAFNGINIPLTNLSDLANSTLLPITTSILYNHIIQGVYPNVSIPIGNFTAATLAPGLNITIDKTSDGILIIGPDGNTTASVVAVDIPFGGCIVHVIDTVLLPPGLSGSNATNATDLGAGGLGAGPGVGGGPVAPGGGLGGVGPGGAGGSGVGP